MGDTTTKWLIIGTFVVLFAVAELLLGRVLDLGIKPIDRINPPRLDYVPLRIATAKLKLVTADDYGVMTARTLDVSFGD